MTTWAIIHSATRGYLGQTKDPSYVVQPGHELVEVAADFASTWPAGIRQGRGWAKLSLDAARLEAASEAEHDDAVRVDYPGHAEMRTALANLKQKGQALHQSTASADLKAFLVALNGFVDVLAGRYQPKIPQD